MINNRIPFLVIAVLVDDNFKEIGLRLFHGEEGKCIDVSTRCVADNMDRDINIIGADSNGKASYEMLWLSRIHASTGKIYNSYAEYCKDDCNTQVELQDSQAIIIEFDKTREKQITIVNCIGQVIEIKCRGTNHQYIKQRDAVEAILHHYRKCQKKEKAVSAIKSALGIVTATTLERKQEELKELNERINNDRHAERQAYYGQPQEVNKEFTSKMENKLSSLFEVTGDGYLRLAENVEVPKVLVIPSKEELGYKYIVTGAFRGCESIEKVIFNPGSTLRGLELFKYCINLKEVILLNDEYKFLQGTFSGCENLKRIEVSGEDNNYQLNLNNLMFGDKSEKFRSIEIVAPETVDVMLENYDNGAPIAIKKQRFNSHKGEF